MTAVIYAIGWGPMLAIGYVLVANETITSERPRTWRLVAAWSVIGIVVGQLAIAAHVAPTLVASPRVHGLAMLAALGVVFVLRLLGLHAARVADAQAALLASENRFRLLAENAHDVIAMYRLVPDLACEYISPSLSAVLGYEPAEFYADPELAQRVIEVGDLARLFALVGDTEPTTEPIVVRAQHRDGSLVYLDVQAAPLLDDEGNVVALQTISRDVSDRTRAERALSDSEASFRLLFEANPEPMWVYDLETLSFLEVNRAAMDHYGYTRDEFLAMRITDIRPSDDMPALIEDLRNARPELQRSTGWRHRLRDGRVIEVVITSHQLQFAGHDAVLVAVQDVTERNALERQLRHEAFHDPLTNLPNRALFHDRLQHALARIRRGGGVVGVALLDLDDFKTVNDSLGHTAGDHVLIAVGDRLRTALRPADTVARLGGDEFVVLCEDMAGRAELLEVADRLRAAIAAPVVVADRELVVSASVGLAVSDDPSDSPAELLRHADTAMYQAKLHGRGRWELFDEAMRDIALERLDLEQALRAAIDRDELRLVLQPVVSMTTGHVVTCEALVRWEHPTRGQLGPAEFIGLAEETGLIGPIGEWVLGEACRLAAGWVADVAGRELSIAVNLSVRQLGDAELPAKVAHALESSGLEPGRLWLEITETALMADADRAIAALSALRSLGVQLSVDDFGTGYSSLQYLRRFPVHQVKIDRSFVAGLARHREDFAIVASIVSLAHALGLSVVAEGVETAADYATLQAMGCELLQGFYWTPPLPEPELVDWIAAHEPGRLELLTPLSGLERAPSAYGPDANRLPVTVLLVDDMSEHRLVLRLALEQAGRFRVVAEAADGRTGVALAGQHKPDLVLLDLAMPRFDGQDALPEILAAAPDAKVVVVTASLTDDITRLLIARGASACFQKGVRTDRMLDELEGVLASPSGRASDAASVQGRSRTRPGE